MNLNTSKNYNPSSFFIVQRVAFILCLSSVTAIFGACCSPVFAQENAPDPIARVEATPVPVDSVTLEAAQFGGTAMDAIFHDRTQNVYQTHWERDRGNQQPLCYVRDTRVQVLAGFSVTPANATSEIKIRGAAGNYTFDEKPVNPADGKVQYPWTASDNVLPNTIRPGYDFNIQWQWSKDGGTTWSNAGTSKNQMYVVLKRPSSDSMLLRTVVDVSCSPNANETYSDAIVSNIWRQFSNRTVYRVDQPTRLTYWANNVAVAQDTADLMLDGNGQCGSWANFLNDCLKLQGISSEIKTVRPIYGSSPGGKSAFLIKNWTFDSVGTAPAKAAPFTHKVDTWNTVAEVHDGDGVAGQGNGNPPGSFNEHYLVEHNGVYYDPSYGGIPYRFDTFGDSSTAISAWEDSSLDGFQTLFTGVDDSGRSVSYWVGKRNELGRGKIETAISQYGR